jgi:sarcosine oxidase
MARRVYDVIVVGVGGMGSAAAYHLARRGRRVLAIERFGIPNDMGSSHGLTRIIRYAQSDSRYVVLVRRAYELWRALEAEAGEQLLHITGSLEGGLPGEKLEREVRASLEAAAVAFELLTGREVNQRFPGYELPAEFSVVYQSEGGFLLPERCISAHETLARKHGAEVRERTRVVGWASVGDRVEVTTDDATYEAGSLIISVGAWTASFVDILAPYALSERQVLIWLEGSEPELFTPSRFPVFRLETPEGRYYGFPSFGIPGLKIGRFHHLGEPCDPDTIDRTIRPRDEDVLRGFAHRYTPKAAGRTVATAVCMFTNSPDENFIIDRHPEYSNVVIAAGFSGHGFKFCSVVGEICASLVETGTTPWDISLFGINRFGQSTRMPTP